MSHKESVLLGRPKSGENSILTSAEAGDAQLLAPHKTKSHCGFCKTTTTASDAPWTHHAAKVGSSRGTAYVPHSLERTTRYPRLEYPRLTSRPSVIRLSNFFQNRIFPKLHRDHHSNQRVQLSRACWLLVLHWRVPICTGSTDIYIYIYIHCDLRRSSLGVCCLVCCCCYCCCYCYCYCCWKCNFVGELLSIGIRRFVMSDDAATTASATSSNSNSNSNSNSKSNNENQATQWSSHAKCLFDYTAEELWEGQCLTHYQVLNVQVHASTDQIKKAYRKCSLLYHPDKTGRGDDDYGKNLQLLRFYKMIGFACCWSKQKESLSHTLNTAYCILSLSLSLSQYS
jgi:DnaJ domain